MNKLEVTLGEELFSFSSFEQWVNKAQSWYAQHRAGDGRFIAVDQSGRICRIGRDFMRARDEEDFPVRVFRVDLPL